MACAASVLAGCTAKSVQASYGIIPQPQAVDEASGEPFRLSSSTTIAYPEGNEGLANDAERLAEYIEQLTGHRLCVSTDTAAAGAIVLKDALQSENREAYKLTVDSRNIDINGASAAGAFYGIQTLRKSIPAASSGGADVMFPPVTISDAPRFAYRGAHFDVSRHFFPADSVKAFIDMLALHNINTFHWHLSDDQGWRIEIKSRPELTEKGSRRPCTVIGRNSGVFDSIPVEGFFTQEQARDIVQYAADRHIRIIPEIDLPGHMLAALSAYPELGCTGGPYEVWGQWGVADDVLCAGNDSTLAFIDDVLGELVDIFPAEYFHIGGDECPKTRWENCPKCQARIRALGLKSDASGSKEAKLQSYVMNHAAALLRENGRRVIGWDEILEGGVDGDITIMSWRGQSGGIEAARRGHDVIMTPNTYLYFDYYQTADTENEPLGIGGYVPIEKVYSLEPVPAELEGAERDRILGVQANLWTEYIKTFSHAQYMELPRMAALSEVQWTNQGKKDYDRFVERLPQLLDHYRANGYNYATHVFDVKGELKPDSVARAVSITLSTVDNAPVRYTLDGSMPTEESALYESPVLIDTTATLMAVAVRPSGMSNVYKASASFSKASFAEVKEMSEPHPSYKSGGRASLVDGIFGSNGYKDGLWTGFTARDPEIVIDLGNAQKISKVTLRSLVHTDNWIFDMRGVRIAVSADGHKFSDVASDTYPALSAPAHEIVSRNLYFGPVEARYVKISVEIEKSIPAWHPGKGACSFFFTDEILID